MSDKTLSVSIKCTNYRKATGTHKLDDRQLRPQSESQDVACLLVGLLGWLMGTVRVQVS